MLIESFSQGCTAFLNLRVIQTTNLQEQLLRSLGSFSVIQRDLTLGQLNFCWKYLKIFQLTSKGASLAITDSRYPAHQGLWFFRALGCFNHRHTVYFKGGNTRFWHTKPTSKIFCSWNENQLLCRLISPLSPKAIQHVRSAPAWEVSLQTSRRW